MNRGCRDFRALSDESFEMGRWDCILCRVRAEATQHDNWLSNQIPAQGSSASIRPRKLLSVISLKSWCKKQLTWCKVHGLSLWGIYQKSGSFIRLFQPDSPICTTSKEPEKCLKEPAITWKETWYQVQDCKSWDCHMNLISGWTGTAMLGNQVQWNKISDSLEQEIRFIRTRNQVPWNIMSGCLQQYHKMLPQAVWLMYISWGKHQITSGI